MFLETLKSLSKSIGLFFIYIVIYLMTNSYFNNIYLNSLIPSLFIIGITITLYGKELIKSLKNIKKDFNKKLFIFGIITIIISILLNYLFIKIFGNTSINQQNLINNLHKYNLFYAILIIFVTPLTEELVFRYPYDTSLNKYSFLISSIIFIALHINSTNELIYIIAYLVPTIGLTLNYFKTKNIYISYLLHVINNLINVLLLIW